MKQARHERIVVANRPHEKPLIVYDGECGVCKRIARRLKHLSGGRSDYTPFQSVAEQFPEVTIARFEQSVKFIDTNGEVCEGAEASFRAIALMPSIWYRLPLWFYRQIPGVRSISETVYRYIATHRRLLSVFVGESHEAKDEQML